MAAVQVISLVIPILVLLTGTHGSPSAEDAADVKTSESFLKTNDSSDSDLCYDELGCLVQSPEWISEERPLKFNPWPREKINTTFVLHTRKYAQGVSVNIPKMLATDFSGSRPTKMIIHGLRGSTDNQWVKEMVQTFLEHYDVNVFTVDWSEGADTLYWRATGNMPVVGLEVAYLIKWLMQNFDADPADIHIIGHSMGAHIAGYAGEKIPGLGRITGLDPAGPFFIRTAPIVRLDPSDAQFVDAIHTDAGRIHVVWHPRIETDSIGINQTVGDIDFSPNGGEAQPGCEKEKDEPLREVGSVTQDDKKAIPNCSHLTATHYFTKTINPEHCPAVAFMCDSYEKYLKGGCISCGEDGSRCARMGMNAIQWKRSKNWKQNRPTEPSRKFFLTTGPITSPCLHHSELDLTFTRPLKHLNGLLTFGVESDGKKVIFEVNPRYLPSEENQGIKNGHHHRAVIVSHKEDVSDLCINGSSFSLTWKGKNSRNSTTIPLKTLLFKSVDASVIRGEPAGSRKLVWTPNANATFTVTTNKTHPSYTCVVFENKQEVEKEDASFV